MFPSAGQRCTEPCCVTRTFAPRKAIGDPPFLPYSSLCSLQLHLQVRPSQTLCQSCSAPRAASWGQRTESSSWVKRSCRAGEAVTTFVPLITHPALFSLCHPRVPPTSRRGAAVLSSAGAPLLPVQSCWRHPEPCSHLGSAAGQSRSCLAESPICSHCSLSSSSFKQRGEGRAALSAGLRLRVPETEIRT